MQYFIIYNKWRYSSWILTQCFDVFPNFYGGNQFGYQTDSFVAFMGLINFLDDFMPS